MTGDVRRCADPEVIAAFVAGTLSGEELRMTADHVRECEDCRQVLSDVAYVDREYEGVVVPMRRKSRWPWWLAVAAAALAVTVTLAIWHPWTQRDDSPMHALVVAAPRERRLIEPRLTGGFPWAPLIVHRSNSESLDTAQLQFAGVAGKVIERTEKDPSIDGRHAAALAHFIAGQTSEAADRLAVLANANAKDARIWSDLAAARYALALQTDEPSHLASALAAADEALRLAPALPEARFNRALIVDRLGLRNQARDAWNQYLAVDPSSNWAAEARHHLADLTQNSTFRELLNRDYARLQKDPAAARSLANRFPQEARMWGESEILSRWARAHLARDRAAAEGHLRLARFFGDALVERSGERMLRDAVSAIDLATPRTRDVLANGHIFFRSAQDDYGKRRYAVAEKRFVAASQSFAIAKSPLRLAAQYYALNTAFDQGRNDEARAGLEQLASSSPVAFTAHLAQVQWQLGLAYGSAARWGDSIRSLTASMKSFETLGEIRNGSLVREILASVYDQIGDPQTAWTHRFAVLKKLGETEDRRLQVALDSAARAATMQAQWPAAKSFLTLELEMARRSEDDARVARSLVFRALVALHLKDRTTAISDLASSSRSLALIRTAEERKSVEMDRVLAAVRLAPNPAETVTLLNEAIAYHKKHGRQMVLPDLYLHRSRALRARSDFAGAMHDLDAGIAELEKQRLSVQAGDQRWGVFGNGEELFEEAVALAVARGETERAFGYAERARARQLLESLGLERPVRVIGQIPADEVLVEYAALPESLFIFVVQDGRVSVVKSGTSRDGLTNAVSRLMNSIEASDLRGARVAASGLYDTLIAPIARTLPASRSLVIVPDATLRAVPFAGLMNPEGRYLIEDRAVVVAPSAAVFVRLVARRTNLVANPRLLLMEGAAGGAGNLVPLVSARREADDIAAVYGRYATLGDKDADRAAFERDAAAADVVHFVGHGVMSEDGRDAALVLSRSAGPAGRLDARGVASLSLRRTRVVVLAACGSARGEERAGEGTISVARGFLAAGVPSVIATLWPIEDGAAAEFFPRVHRHLAAGLSPAEALRAAQIESIRQRREPFGMWAAVQVLGT